MLDRNRWVWTVVAAAGLGLGYAAALPLVSQSTARAAAADGKEAKDDKKAGATFEVYKDKAGEFRWRLRTTNSQVIAASGQGYKDKRDCMAGVESVKRNAPAAAVEEVSGS